MVRVRLVIGWCGLVLHDGRHTLAVLSKAPRARRDTQADGDVISSVLAYSNSRSLLRTAQAIRASLLASAIASTLWCSRFLAASIQGLSPWRSQVFGLISTTQAACTNRTRR